MYKSDGDIMIILFGPSATGKTEIAKYLGNKYNIKKVITNTTRPIRIGEIDKVDYNFISKEEFLKLKDQDLFVETTLYNNNYYGCLKSQVSDYKIVVLDPTGVKNFLKLNNPKICVFYLQCDEKIRIERMKARLDKDEDIKKRLINDQLTFAKENLPQYNYLIETENRSIEEIADEIFNKYQDYLKML